MPSYEAGYYWVKEQKGKMRIWEPGEINKSIMGDYWTVTCIGSPIDHPIDKFEIGPRIAPPSET